jgi:hypothetical protein
MKKWLLVGVILIMFCGTVFAEEYDFRHIRWGMSRQEVMKAESGNPIRNETVESKLKGEKVHLLIYRSSIKRYECNLIYIFDLKKGLYEARYEVVDAFKSQAEYIVQLEIFVRELSEKYGQPVSKSSKFGTNIVSWKLGNTSIAIDYFNQDGTYFANSFEITYRGTSIYSDL